MIDDMDHDWCDIELLVLKRRIVHVKIDPISHNTRLTRLTSRMGIQLWWMCMSLVVDLTTWILNLYIEQLCNSTNQLYYSKGYRTT
jgi:hypothetical protein